MDTSYTPIRNYTKISNTIIDQYMPEIGHSALVVYLYYCRLVNKKTGYAFPAIDTTAKKLGLSQHTIVRANYVLEKAGLIEKIKGRGSKHNAYLIKKPIQKHTATRATPALPDSNASTALEQRTNTNTFTA